MLFFLLKTNSVFLLFYGGNQKCLSSGRACHYHVAVIIVCWRWWEVNVDVIKHFNMQCLLPNHAGQCIFPLTAAWWDGQLHLGAIVMCDNDDDPGQAAHQPASHSLCGIILHTCSLSTKLPATHLPSQPYSHTSLCCFISIGTLTFIK